MADLKSGFVGSVLSSTSFTPRFLGKLVLCLLQKVLTSSILDPEFICELEFLQAL